MVRRAEPAHRVRTISRSLLSEWCATERESESRARKSLSDLCFAYKHAGYDTSARFTRMVRRMKRHSDYVQRIARRASRFTTLVTRHQISDDADSIASKIGPRNHQFLRRPAGAVKKPRASAVVLSARENERYARRRVSRETIARKVRFSSLRPSPRRHEAAPRAASSCWDGCQAAEPPGPYARPPSAAPARPLLGAAGKDR